MENLLLSTRGQIKLCDFGSATTRQYEPDHSWSAVKRSLVEDEVRLTVISSKIEFPLLVAPFLKSGATYLDSLEGVCFLVDSYRNF